MASRKQPPAKKPAARITGKRAKPAPQAQQRPKAKSTKKPAKAANGSLLPHEKKKNGRPPIYSPELATAFCEHLITGDTLREACARDGMPNVKTILNWLQQDTGGFRAQYARAREAQAELDADDQVAIADAPARMVPIEWIKRADGKGGTEKIPVVVAIDAGEIAQRRLRVESRRWRATKMAPKKYGGLQLGDGDGLALVVVNDLTGRKPQGAPPAGYEHMAQSPANGGNGQ